MSKRVVALLLLPTVLLPHWVSARQCYGCEQAAGHDHNPHVHLMGWPFTGSDSRDQDHQVHGRDDCCHHDADEPDDDTPVPHHDSKGYQGGIVYLPTAVLLGWSGGSTATHANDGNIPSLALSDNLLIQVQPLICTHVPPPLLAEADTPACLRTLPLLI